jgi:hypothetical protein
MDKKEVYKPPHLKNKSQSNIESFNNTNRKRNRYEYTDPKNEKELEFDINHHSWPSLDKK